MLSMNILSKHVVYASFQATNLLTFSTFRSKPAGMDEDSSAYGAAVEALLRMYDAPDAAPEDYFRELGQLLRIYRVSRNMTQSELARRMFVGRSWVNRLEKGEGRPSRNLVIHLGYVLGLKTPEVNILLFLSRHSPILKKRGDKDLRGLLLM